MSKIRTKVLKLSDELYFNGYEQMSRDVDDIINMYDEDELFLKTLSILQSYYEDIRGEEEAQAVGIVRSIIKLLRTNIEFISD